MADKQGQIEAMAAEQRMKGDLMNRMLGDRPLIPENRMPTGDMPMPRRMPMPTRDDIPSSSTMPHGKDWIPRTDDMMPPLTRKKLMEPVR